MHEHSRASRLRSTNEHGMLAFTVWHRDECIAQGLAMLFKLSTHGFKSDLHWKPIHTLSLFLALWFASDVSE